MKKRSNDPFLENLQDLTRKAKSKGLEPSVILSQETKKSQGENKLLKALGERLAPEGTRHMSSFAVHLYKQKNSDDGIFLAQANSVIAIPELVAQKAIQSLTRHIMSAYGQKVPKKTDSPPVSSFKQDE